MPKKQSFLQTVRERLEVVKNDYSEEEALFQGGDIPLIDTTLVESLTETERQRYKKSRDAHMRPMLYGQAKAPSATVIVPVRGGGDILAECLSSISRQSIVVERGSTVELVVIEDGTPEDSVSVFTNSDVEASLSAIAARNVSIKLLQLAANHGRAQARNIGLASSKNSVVFFVDASMILDSSFLAENLWRHGRLGMPVALLGFKENLAWEDFIADRRLIVEGQRRPDFRRDIKMTHTLSKEEAGEEGFRFRATHFSSKDSINYMELTNFLKDLGGNELIGKRTLPSFFQTNIVSVPRDLLLSVGGFESHFQGWGLEDTFLGALLLARGCHLIPCPSALAFNLDKASQEISSKDVDLELARQKFLEFTTKTRMDEYSDSKFAATVSGMSGRVVTVALTAPARSSTDFSLSISRLPAPGPHFVGRRSDVARLDKAWKCSVTNIISIVAFGGVGKTALLYRWLDSLREKNWGGAEEVFAWSFHSQGAEGKIESADSFIDHALRRFGDADPSLGFPYDRGVRLAEILRPRRVLLILDGIESMQYPPGPLRGKIREPGLAALVRELALSNTGLCIVTTRERIADLANLEASTAPCMNLDDLPRSAGMKLLRKLGVRGSDMEMAAAVKEVHGHALTLTLLGNYLHKAWRGDIRRRTHMALLDVDRRQGGHAFRILKFYERTFEDGVQLSILRLLGLFERPASIEEVNALREMPVIKDLTDGIARVDRDVWSWAITCLRDQGLLVAVDDDETSLDAHPLVREYFSTSLEEDFPRAWKLGNRRLYEFLRDSTPEFPETLDQMQGLYGAIVFGCRAGLQERVFQEEFLRRLQRGDQYFNTKKLGAFGAELGVLAAFFARTWDRPSERLTLDSRAKVLSHASVVMRALGRIDDAAELTEASMKLFAGRKSWRNAAVSAGSLAGLLLTGGFVSRAVRVSREAVVFADRSADLYARMITRTVWANCLHQQGRYSESEAAFVEARDIQVLRDPDHGLLFSVQGYQYCDLQFDRFKKEEQGSESIESLATGIMASCRVAMGWASDEEREVLFSGFGNLLIGRCFMELASLKVSDEPQVSERSEQARVYIDRGIEYLRRAGFEEYLAVGLLLRGSFRRFQSDAIGGRRDFLEAFEIAERSSMRLLMCDLNLELCLLEIGEQDLDSARRYFRIARELVRSTGYSRRTTELGRLDRSLKGAG